MTSDSSFGRMALPEPESVKARFAELRRFHVSLREEMREGHDYGDVWGSDDGSRGGSRQTLLLPGAEKVVDNMGLVATYDVVESASDWDVGLFQFVVKCTLVSMRTGEILAQGLGECNSYDSKYRYRWLWESQVRGMGLDKEALPSRMVNTRNGQTPKFRVENDDLAAVRNTVIKMARKRAYIAAAISAGSLSEVFTQDLEDMAHENGDAPKPEPQRDKRPQASQGQAPKGNGPQGNGSALSRKVSALRKAVQVAYKDKGMSPGDAQALAKEKLGEDDFRKLNEEQLHSLLKLITEVKSDGAE